MNLRSGSYLLAFLLAIVPWFQPIACGQQKSRWESFLIEGERHLARKDMEQAVKFFRAASDFAVREGSWAGVIRAGFGFLAADHPDAAMNSWVRARDIAWKKKEWRGVLRAGDCMLHLQEGKEAAETFRIARDLADEQRSPEVIVWAARGFLVLHSNEQARDLTDQAGEIFQKMENGKGLYRTAQNYALLGQQKSADEIFDILQQWNKDEDVKTYPRYRTNTLLVQGLGTTELGLASKLEVVTGAEQKPTLKVHVTREIRSIGGTEFSARCIVESVMDGPTVRDGWREIGVIGVLKVDEIEHESIVSFELEARVNPYDLRLC